ncbi:GyrI-like domain-containing protein [Dactylosporangium sp. AC04546]|uniref:GyrI-like domain-containing protein n=1 Tax=Dactylosporangium sp. AC04546 TaxID=2862460 RepID=UPI001EDEBD02|nr:GyrI-like domain-containing protein [Dactylosporangium sp. AC04546]WVK81331.1 GyrI-like domain-containing protein [Dactylosporangium sp. AC04546]
MTTLDLRKLHRPLYTAGAEPEFVDVPPLPFLMVDGAGDPAGEAYLDAVGRLYKAAYRVRAVLKAAGTVYSVPPLQGLWTDVGDGRGDRSAWKWTMLLQQPAGADAAMQDVEGVRFETFTEGPSVHVLHVGPYAQETPAIERLLAFAARHDRAVTGTHHEIYLSDPRRTAPERLRTIIRYGVTA